MRLTNDPFKALAVLILPALFVTMVAATYWVYATNKECRDKGGQIVIRANESRMCQIPEK